MEEFGALLLEEMQRDRSFGQGLTRPRHLMG